MDDPAAMKLLSQLGSDLNVNAFACNFRINAGTIVNDDVYAANFLNQRILSKLSAPPSGNIKSVPFWLTSTELSQKEYGNCATHFKKRLGLRGDADIFVLRNVVMSPFSTGGRFISKVLVSEFEKVLREETEVSIMYRVCLQAPWNADRVFVKFRQRLIGQLKNLLNTNLFCKASTTTIYTLSTGRTFTMPVTADSLLSLLDSPLMPSECIPRPGKRTRWLSSFWKRKTSCCGLRCVGTLSRPGLLI